VEDRTQNKKDWSLEILTPAQMETFLKDFNSETIQYYEYLNDMESTINKQKDILIKSQELDKDFTNRKSNLNKSAQNLDGGRSSEIEKIEVELNAEVSKADIKI
jgi:DNA repair ATPase RecN